MSISPGIAADASCEICLERMAVYRCCRCSFVLCGHCKGEFRKNVVTDQLLDQCGQCKKEPPWMRTLDPVDMSGEAFIHHQSIVIDIVPGPDIENQQNRIYEPFISYEIAKNIRRYAKDFLLCFSVFLVAELVGFLFMLLSGQSDMIKASVSKGNEHFIILIMVLCGVIGLLIMIILMIVLIPCGFCVAVVIIGTIDER